MRGRMIAALDFPRNLVLSLIEQRECPCGERFEAGNEFCSECDLSRECHWATFLDEYSDFEGQPTYTINASLRYGVRLVEELNGDLSHDPTACTCDACSWLRGARQLIAEFERTLPPNRFRPAH